MFTGILADSPKNIGILTAVLCNDGSTKFYRSTILIGVFSFLLAILAWSPGQAAQSNSGRIPIGQVQGRGSHSSQIGQTVHLRGIAIGMREDENARGARFYTVFIQDVRGTEDGDPETSDGIPLFFGASRPAIAIGDVINVSGVVTEFYGLTEIDFRDLRWAVEARNQPLPEAIELDPPVGNLAAADYYEQFEGMLVTLPRSVVVGPTHEACGFAAVRDDGPPFRVFKHQINEPGGLVINVLHHTDVNCDSFPAVSFGDEIEGISGPLTYHFEQFKIVLQDPTFVQVTHKPATISPPVEKLDVGQISLATFNLDNYFDSVNDTDTDAEPILGSASLIVKKDKLTHAIATALGCPTLIAVQEVEHSYLLTELAEMLEEPCDFLYDVTHKAAPDARGSDLALMSDPRHVLVTNVFQQQACTTLDTGVIDSNITCTEGAQPLFSRPPLQVDVLVDDVPLTIIVNHLKSKRGGEAETFVRRMAQAEHLHSLARSLLSEENGTAIAVVGDFNDYYQSPVMEELTAAGYLSDILYIVPEDERYSYIFDGYSQLIDWILFSPSLLSKIVSVQIVHVNSDFYHTLSEKTDELEISYRSSDHDIPLVILQMKEPQDRSAVITPTSAPTPLPDVQLAPTGTMGREIVPTSTIEKQEAITPSSEPLIATQTAVTSIESGSRQGENTPVRTEFRIGIILLATALGAGIVALFWHRSKT